MMSTQNQNTSDREMAVTRLLDAPRELVWDAWTNPKHIGNWWGPNGFSTTTHEMDVRPGGAWRHTMHGPDGVDYPNHSTYTEVIRPERLVYTHAGTKPGEPGVKFQAIVTFEDVGGKTRLTMRGIFDTAEDFQRVAKQYGAIEGQKQTIQRLTEYLAEYLASAAPKG